MTVKQERKTEAEKLENARRCVALFWELFDLLGYWAQCHSIAYARSKFDNEFTETMMDQNENLHSGSHVLEEVGNYFIKAISADFDDMDLNFFDSDKKHLAHRGSFSQILRLFIFDMLASNSSPSHPWRFLLQKARRAMNAGQTEDVFKPMQIRKSGTPFELAEWKHEALLKVYFRVGQGFKKYRALEIVGEGIGQSIETLRDWERNPNTMRNTR